MYKQLEAFTGTWRIRLSFLVNNAGVNQIVTMTAHLKGFKSLTQDIKKIKNVRRSYRYN